MTQCGYFDGMSNARCCYHSGHSGDHFCSREDESDRIRWKLAADEREQLRQHLAASQAEVERLADDLVHAEAALERMTAARDEACRIAESLCNGGELVGLLERIFALRKIGGTP